MRKKQGISLIVLVITIIVMIILAASVVITLSNNGIIDKASQAVQLTDEKQVQDLAALIWAEAYLDEERTDTIENIVKEKLKEQGVTEDKWDITVTETGVTVMTKTNGGEEGNEYGYLSGTWVFNNEVNHKDIYNDGSSEFEGMYTTAINYTSNGYFYNVMEIGTTSDEGQFISYGNFEISGTQHISHAYDMIWFTEWTNEKDRWVSDEYRILDFGSEPQSVSQEFYDWFIANATKQ